MTDKEKTRRSIKTGIKIVTTFLVDIFIGAVTNSVMNGVKGGKVARFGAKAGGFMVGAWLGDQVAEHICGEFDEYADEFDEIEASVTASKEDA